MGSARIAALVLCALGAGCGGDAQYDVEVEVVGDPSRVTWLQVAVIERCANLESPSDAPTEPVRVVEFDGTGSTAPIGYLAPGRYGLQGRAWSDGCVLYAAQCEDISLESGGDGTLHLLLEPADGRGCDPGHSCVDDACVADPNGT